ncbi:MAG: Gfo/Idh/MocA family oxidoreductase, partial [Thiotrichales bacterium]|nr:Gfo/Idh/MocA family oxidoreductase [Thiotrichales bacterium]
IVDPSDSAQRQAADRAVPWFGSLSEAFAGPAPDGVVLATPTPLHVEQGLECIARRCPTLVEKPLATSSADARRLVEAAEASGVPLLVGHHRRHNPLIQKAFEVIKAGEIGEILAVHANCWFYKPEAYFDEAPWRKLRGAGPISVNLVHDVDLIRHLCGEVVSVQAQAAPSRRGFENEEVAAAILQFRNGAIGTITVSDRVVSPWSWELTAGENPIYSPTAESCYLIGGSHGSLSIPDTRLWTHKGERNWSNPISATTLPHDASNPLENQIAHFAAVIAGREQPLVSGQEGLKTLQVIEAIQTATRQGDSVLVDQQPDRANRANSGVQAGARHLAQT